MSKRVWKDLGELETPTGVSQDEFSPAVAAAVAQLRQAHGIDDANGQPLATSVALSGDADAFRDELHTALPGVNRRGFLQLTGAAAVFALAGCWHKKPDTLVPYASQPEGSTLGKPVYWSTTLRDSGRPVGVMVKTYDGRPIKLEGNPDHPLNRGQKVKGALDLATQAALLNLYDPDRAQNGPLSKRGGSESALTWDQLDEAVGTALKSGRIGLITGPVDGVASRALLDQFTAAFGKRLTHAAYAPFAEDTAVEARRWSFGKDAAKPPVYHLERASTLVCLGSDFLGGGTTTLADQIAFGDFRRLRGAGKDAEVGQVIVFEPTLSQTGTIADIRVRATMAEVEAVAWGIAKALGAAVPDSLAPASVEDTTLKTINGYNAVQFVADRLKALKAAGKHSLVYVGGATHCGENSRGLHIAANLINSLLGNEGVTVETVSAPVSAIPASIKATAELLAEVGSGIEHLIVVGANPAASLPGAAAQIAKATTVVVIADRSDETFAAASTGYLAPSLHGLESWGDAEPVAGVHSIQQPMILPLWDARAAEESLMAFAVAALGTDAAKAFVVDKAPVPVLEKDRAKTICSRKELWTAAQHGIRPWAELVQATWLAAIKPAAKVAADDRTFWTSILAKGVVVVAQAAKPTAVTFNDAALQALRPPAKPSTPYSLVLSASRALADGVNANNALLLEIPDPVSRITWDNYLAVSPADAAAFGVKRQAYATGWENPVVELKVAGTTLTLPVHVQEGQHPGTVECFFGWGRPTSGKVAEGGGPLHDGGLNAFLIGSDARWGLPVDTVTVLPSTYRLACTQGHNTMDGRDIVRDDVLDLFRNDPGKQVRENKHTLWNRASDGESHGRLSMWSETQIYPGRRWGMTVDLGTCTGCQACVVACSVENNVPVVGRDEVRKGREMHWIRVDRYFSSPAWSDGKTPDAGKPESLLDIEATQMPTMCQQCGHAPCEEVCPAMATMHNEEGINVQVYNRCIGTRYCSNNCPYKVRRFNFYEYSKYRSGPKQSYGVHGPFTRIEKNLLTEGSTSGRDELSRAPLQMMLNPTVSVRSKGVMEKCNFCIQRTRDVREQEKASGHKYDEQAPGAVTTACAQTCPTGAITFGDINDPHSAVNAVAAASPHAYRLLDEVLNTRPSVLYLQRVRNRPATADELLHDGHAAHGPAASPAAHGEAH